jgi:hypothetical protein
VSKARDDDRRGDDDGDLDVSLEHSRGRNFVTAVLGLGLGVLAVWGLGWLGRIVIGGLLLGYGLRAAWAFVETLRHDPGRIAILGEELHLTPRLCAGTTLVVKLGDVRHAYLLKRAVPWTKSGPILILETQSGVFEYPRDWFPKDGDHQRRVAHALNARLGRH